MQINDAEWNCHLHQNKMALVNLSPAKEGNIKLNNWPAYVRLPRTGKRCEWTGLSRSSMSELVLGSDAPVVSVMLRKEGASRGIRLVHFDSLLNHLHSKMERQGTQSTIEKEVSQND